MFFSFFFPCVCKTKGKKIVPSQHFTFLVFLFGFFFSFFSTPIQQAANASCLSFAS